MVADTEHVEQPPVGKQHGAGDDRVREHERHLAPSRHREPPEEPGVHLVDHLGVPLLDECLHGGEQAGHGDAREDQRRSRPGAVSGRADGVRHQHGAQGSDEGGERDRAERRGGREPRHDGDRGTQPGAGRHAEQIRVGQRIAEDPLVRRPGHGEHGAYEETKHHTRQPQLPDDQSLLMGQAAVQVDPRDVVEDAENGATGSDGGRADDETEQGGDEHRRRPAQSPPHRVPSHPPPVVDLVASTMTWRKSGTRGPHRDATSSSRGRKDSAFR